MEPVLALNYPVPMFDELLGFFGSGSEPGSIPNSNHPYEFQNSNDFQFITMQEKHLVQKAGELIISKDTQY